MEQFLYRINPTRGTMLSEGPDERESAIIARHFEYLQTLAAQGVVILAGRSLTIDESAFGIAILNAPDQTAAEAIMQQDPAVAEQVMRAELFPFRIAIAPTLGI